MTWDGLLRKALCPNCRARLIRRLNEHPDALKNILHRIKQGLPVKL